MSGARPFSETQPARGPSPVTSPLRKQEEGPLTQARSNQDWQSIGLLIIVCVALLGLAYFVFIAR